MPLGWEEAVQSWFIKSPEEADPFLEHRKAFNACSS